MQKITSCQSPGANSAIFARKFWLEHAGNFVQYLTETLVQTFDKNQVNADQRPLDDSVENLVGLQIVAFQSNASE